MKNGPWKKAWRGGILVASAVFVFASPVILAVILIHNDGPTRPIVCSAEQFPLARVHVVIHLYRNDINSVTRNDNAPELGKQMIFRRRFLKRRRRRRHAVRTRTICNDLFTFPGQQPRLKHLNVDLPTKRRRFVVIPISCAGDDSRRSRRTYPGRVYHWAFHTPVCKLSTFIEQHETRTVKRVSMTFYCCNE